MNKTKALLFIIIFIGLFCWVSELFVDKRVTRPINMSLYTVKGFYQEPQNTLDIVAIGSSQCYTSIVPAILWRDYGITSYDFCVEQQGMISSYYYAKEAIKRQSSATILLEIGESRARKDISDEMFYVNTNDLPFSTNKLSMIMSANPASQWLNYIFTINKYHSTWKTLNKSKIKNMWYNKLKHNKGYGAEAYDKWAEGKAPKDYDITQTDRTPIPAESEEYLKKIIKYAKKHNAELILFKAPSSNLNKRTTINYIADIAHKYNVPFIDFNEQMEGYHHLSVPQAAQMTKLLGDYLKKNYHFKDKRRDAKYNRWNKTIKFYKQQTNKYHLKKSKDLITFLELLKNNNNYIILISVKDATSRKNNNVKQEVIKIWNDLGLNPEILKKSSYRNSYIAIIDEKNIKFEQMDKNKILLKRSIHNLGQINITSAGWLSGNVSSIKINRQELSPNKRGINIVVWDKLLEGVVAVKSFDTLADYYIDNEQTPDIN